MLLQDTPSVVQTTIQEFLKNLPEILKAASLNILALSALGIIVIGILAWIFKVGSDRFRVASFFIGVVSILIILYLGFTKYSNGDIIKDTTTNEYVKTIEEFEITNFSLGTIAFGNTKSYIVNKLKPGTNVIVSWEICLAENCTLDIGTVRDKYHVGTEIWLNKNLIANCNKDWHLYHGAPDKTPCECSGSNEIVVPESGVIELKIFNNESHCHFPGNGMAVNGNINSLKITKAQVQTQ